MTGETAGEQVARFLYCPYDGTALESDRTHPDGKDLTCRMCSFVDYGNPKPCVAVLIERKARLLLGRRGVDPAKGTWDIPGGFVEPGESAEETVAREVLEETGLHLSEITYLGSIADTYAEASGRRVPTLNLCFAATPSDGPARAASDVDELCWFPPDALPDALAFSHQRKLLDAWRRNPSRPYIAPRP